ncbi:MAG: hypothetical protein V7L25_01560 [Nostoc sp.]|uniref:hypothetical protein n=1 Tax=Nostoc sp. TaxID=1180 RepID=UPI002FEF7116
MKSPLLLKVIYSTILIALSSSVKAEAYQLSGVHKVHFDSYKIQADVPGIISNFPVTLDKTKPSDSFEEFDFDNNKVYEQVDVTTSYGTESVKSLLYGSGFLQNVQVVPTADSNIYTFSASANITTGGFKGDESDEYSFEHTEFQNLLGTLTLDSQQNVSFQIDKNFFGSGTAKTLPGVDENINVPVQYKGTGTLVSVSVAEPQPFSFLADTLAFSFLGLSLIINWKNKKHNIAAIGINNSNSKFNKSGCIG